MKIFDKGFTLIELMIVIVIIAILVSLSYPSYVNFIRKADRGEAQGALLDWSNRQEIWRADNPSYNPDINPTDTDLYTFTIINTDSSYTLTATARNRQTDDTEAGVDCSTLTLDQQGTPGPAGHLECWGK